MNERDRIGAGWNRPLLVDLQEALEDALELAQESSRTVSAENLRQIIERIREAAITVVEPR